MKSLIILILSLCANCLICFGQTSSINPISLGSILVDQPSLNKMIEYCQQYKLIEVPSDNDCRAFKHDDGTLIKFNIETDSIGNKKPYVEIHTTESNKEIERVILGAGFYKEKIRYVKGSKFANRFTTCHIIGQNDKRVIFSKEKGHIKSY